VRAPLYSERSDEIFSPAVIEQPQRLYAPLRQQRPLSRIAETGVHLVARWDLIEEALGREADFSANLTGVLATDADGKPSVFEFPDTGATAVIATADEPEHAVHRALSQPRLASKRVAQMEPLIRSWCRNALAPWLVAGGGEFVPIAEEIPARAIAHLLGLPEADVGRHRTWAMMGGDMLAGGVAHGQIVALARETQAMSEYLHEHLARASADLPGTPDSPLLSALAAGVQDGALPREAAVGISIVMFGAAGESTAALLGSAVRVLASNPELADALRATPAQLPRFIEEIARLESPFNFHYRLVRRDCELGGFELTAGDRLMLAWASANRDPDYFEAPDQLRLDRRHPNHHMGFGRGRHFCIGAPLARLEARVLLEEILARAERLKVRDGSVPVHASSIFVRRLQSLVVDVTPR
jgi:cytochrome P450